MLKSIPVNDIRRRGSIRDADVAALRAAFDVCHEITTDDAETLFSLHVSTPIQAPAWSKLFIEIITDYIVSDIEPKGYIVGQNARWLIENVSTFGRVETSTEMDLLLSVLEAARWSPPSLAAFALDQIRHAVETGSGPLRANRKVPRGHIAPSEVAMAGRIFSAFGRETNIALTRTEADAIVALNRAITPGGESPAWTEFFVRAVGAGVLSSLGHAVPPRFEIIATMGNSDATNDHLSLMLAVSDTPTRTAAAQSTGCNVWHSARLLSPEECALTRLERQRLEIVTNEVIEDASATWLLDKLQSARNENPSEATLVAHVAREASRLPPDFEDYARHRSAA